jgi:hypothetical protein
MADKKTLTFALMDPPYENARSTTALRLINIAAKRGYDINVFAYEELGFSGLCDAEATSQRNAWTKRRGRESRPDQGAGVLPYAGGYAQRWKDRLGELRLVRR